jgi:cytochrome P450
MKLSWRVVQESMRLTPPGTANFRMAPHDMIHDGFRIPKSWKVLLPI